MTARLLQPDQPLPKIILMTRTDRWSSVLRQHSPAQQRIMALNWSDLINEARQWPGSVAIIEVDTANLVAVCQAALEWRRHVKNCPIFAVTDLVTGDVGNTLAVAGFLGTIGSPLAASRLFRQVARHLQSFQPNDVVVEASFRQRLPWRPLDRYPGNPFQPTHFSTSSGNLTLNSDRVATAQQRND